MTTTDAAEWVLRGQHLTLGYGRRALFHDLAFTVSRGQILGIVGPNGSGKSTLLKTMLGLLAPLAGSVERRPARSSATCRSASASTSSCPSRRSRSSRWGSRPGLAPFTAPAPQIAGPRWTRWRCSASSRLAGSCFAISRRGQQQRVLLARALAGAPDVLVLDEPTVGMDIASEAAMLDFLQDINRSKGVTILIVTHLLPIVLNLATTVVVMASGTVLQGSADDVLQQDKLTRLYGVSVHLGTVAGRRTLVVDRGSRRHV